MKKGLRGIPSSTSATLPTNADKSANTFFEMEDYLAKPNNIFAQFDWWIFSKLDQTLDEVFIPYYKENRIGNFKPDFIFWAEKNKQYHIVFVDPKGTIFTGYEYKVDGFKRIFENKKHSYNGYEIFPKLLFYTNDIAQVGPAYREYWFDNFDDFAEKLKL